MRIIFIEIKIESLRRASQVLDMILKSQLQAAAPTRYNYRDTPPSVHAHSTSDNSTSGGGDGFISDCAAIHNIISKIQSACDPERTHSAFVSALQPACCKERARARLSIHKVRKNYCRDTARSCVVGQMGF